MSYPNENQSRLLLHACCGPCSLEPTRILREEGHDFDIFYANSNIAPAGEYEMRLQTLCEWADSENINMIEGEYDHDDWINACKTPFEHDEISREERCRHCYRIRFEETVSYASKNGYETICTTLSVSPYQYTNVIKEELERACANEGLKCIFRDFRPYYDEATRRSRDAGMYRQNYCGCELSAVEAAQEREERKYARKREQERKRAEKAEELAAEKAQIDKRKEERRQYDKERSRRRAILKQMRTERRESAEKES